MADSNNISDSQNSSIVKIRDQYFYIEIYLYNQIEGSVPFQVPFLLVDSFSIQETLMNWINQGWIILNEDFEVIERGSTETVAYDKGNSITFEAIKAPYIFRTDGRNKISFRLYPKKSNDSNINSNDFPKENWEICYDFVIYDIEDLPTGSNQKKLRKYYFWDERYQLFSERNIEYSTAYTATGDLNKSGTLNTIAKTLKGGNDAAKLKDIKKAVNPNIVLQEIIKTASANPPIMTNTTGKTKIKIGFKEGGSIENPTEPIDDFDNDKWDKGKQDNLILYTSPANYTVLDDINYVLDYCVSSDGGPVFLDLGRTSDDKKWKLIGLSTLFKNSNDEQIERFIIEDSITPSNKPPVERASTDTSDNLKNFTSPVASRITNYKFTPMVASDDARITNAPIHNYDFSTGEFKIIFTDNKAIDVRNKLQQYGKMGLFNFSSSNTNSSNSHILLNLNLTKTKGIQLKNNFVAQRFYPKNLSQIKMMKDALFLNEAISFEVQGLTFRTPGKFIYIDRLASTGDTNPFDDRFLGQWLIIKVNHVFTQSSYMTEIVAVKVDTFSKLWELEESKY